MPWTPLASPFLHLVVLVLAALLSRSPVWALRALVRGRGPWAPLWLGAVTLVAVSVPGIGVAAGALALGAALIDDEDVVVDTIGPLVGFVPFGATGALVVGLLLRGRGDPGRVGRFGRWLYARGAPIGRVLAERLGGAGRVRVALGLGVGLGLLAAVVD